MGGNSFEFNTKGSKYELPWELLYSVGDWGEPGKNVKGVAVSKLFTNAGDFGEIVYDFVDDWHVGVKLETLNVSEKISADELPCVIKGEGFGIIEDCGGVAFLEEIAEGLKTGKVEYWEDQKSWLEEVCPEVLEKGLEFFDIDEINAAIKEGNVSSIYEEISK
jgi:hypothetical protein